MRRVRGRHAFPNLIPTDASVTADGTEITVAKASKAQEKDSDNNLCIQHYLSNRFIECQIIAGDFLCDGTEMPESMDCWHSLSAR